MSRQHTGACRTVPKVPVIAGDAGRCVRLAPVDLHSERGGARVRASRDGDRRLRPEMFGNVRVSVGTRSALVVPLAAIIHEGNGATVFVKNAGKTEQRTVKTGQAIGGLVEILEGLQEGDEVASDGAELLKGGPGE